MTDLMPAVFSALDAAIDTGFIDKERVAMSRHSYGGYAALATAIQTERFQAIIAMAATSNITSQYGQFSPIGKINSAELDPPGQSYPAWAEKGQGRMGAAPWGDPDRYIRNSPLFHVDKVEIPIMLLNGDIDTAVHVTQAEEMFTALNRAGKQVVFVRYLGENHVIEQPQN